VADTLDLFHMVSMVLSVVYKKPGRPWCEWTYLETTGAEIDHKRKKRILRSEELDATHSSVQSCLKKPFTRNSQQEQTWIAGQWPTMRESTKRSTTLAIKGTRSIRSYFLQITCAPSNEENGIST
jgi:hypothetical protein